ncbi:MAG: peptidylprolyl isomerase [Solirubrobacteraceae bacterium]|nr:peptidylprolyl isomerase [Solirubrobacteraceae bacterium]
MSTSAPEPPSEPLDPGTHVVTLETSHGTFTIELDNERAPITASSFASLVRQGFYDGLTFHRIVPGFVIQGGCPEGTGMGGPGYKVEEAPPSDLRYVRGVVAMAKAGMEPAGTSGSQFFVVTGGDVGLPPEYAYVGHVTSGDDVVSEIEGVRTGRGDVPEEPVIMERVTLAQQ